MQPVIYRGQLSLRVDCTETRDILVHNGVIFRDLSYGLRQLIDGRWCKHAYPGDIDLDHELELSNYLPYWLDLLDQDQRWSPVLALFQLSNVQLSDNVV